MSLSPAPQAAASHWLSGEKASAVIPVAGGGTGIIFSWPWVLSRRWIRGLASAAASQRPLGEKRTQP